MSKKRVSARIACAGAVFFAVACAADEPSDPAGMAGVAAPMSGGVGGSAGTPASGGASGGAATGGNVSAGASGAGMTGGASGASGAGMTGGVSGAGMTGGVSGAGMTGGTSGAGTTGGSGTEDSGTPLDLEPFSFFVTSYEAMERLSGTADGFGGDLRYGEADGLTGADKICTEIAEFSMPGSGQKGWRAFLSVAQNGEGMREDAIDRIGEGPWYDRLGRIVAEDIDALQNSRPEGAHADIINDLPNEYGVPNHRPDPGAPTPDNHHVLTGSDEEGRLYGGNVNGTCDNWTALEDAGRPRIGFSWPLQGRQHWISGQDEGGCGAGVVLFGMGGSDPDNPVVGSGGGYGGIYCFALMP